MGTEHSIADHKNKRLFDLGKGPWSFLLGEEGEIGDRNLLLGGDKQNFISRFLDIWNSWWAEPPTADETSRMQEVGSQLWEFCEEADWQVTLVNDVDDSQLELWRDHGYVETHNRYTETEPRGTC